ncbi:Carbohydrate sulfotransferase 15 [Holothuria leucospilota]|uniref:Carbohydrate sulfotransferase 15 n=1 Tax=Holothuria leucospilota TaxID=206669 RepID=A0A9Q1BVG2_HOLLE|nr:Carbohydrate sulfotransferase 15 [Holothuria leucospilota]
MYTSRKLALLVPRKFSIIIRLYSGYLYHPTKKIRSAAHFHKEATKYVEDFQKCLERSSTLRCVFEKVEEDGDSQRLKVGLYAPLIKHWITRFGSKQVMVIRLEDWKKNCTSILPKVFKFLELKTLSEDSIQSICKDSSKNVNRGVRQNVGEMWPSTKQLLQDFYAPFNKELSEYLNISLYHARI